MTSIGRRKFVLTSASVTLAASLAALAGKRRARALGPWGELVPDPDGILDLPAGFSYAILETGGDDMDDGFQVPLRPDGMACFAGPDNTLILMRNHENSVGADANGPYQAGQAVPPEAYEPAGMGGVSRVVVDATTFERISSNLVLIGTARNCAGGPSPWGWLSCEENVDINNDGIVDHRHGYVFVCPTDAQSVRPPQPIPGYGRFYHEAVAIDPSNYYAYLTEDRIDSCLYRFVPNDMAEPFVGKLQALKIVGEDNFNTTLMADGEVLDVEWVDIYEPDPDDDTVRDEAQSQGAAIIVRGEGIWFFAGQVYICATFGGPIAKGQILRLIDGDSPTLESVVSSTDATVLDNPDNITVSPGGEVFMVEDGDTDQYIRFIDEAGQICDFARNALSESEMAGVCFSPAGDAMFVNIQENGLTLVITGPFDGDSSGDGDGDGDGDSGDGDGDSGETGGDTGTGAGAETGGDLGLEDGDGCSCSTREPEQAGLATALTLAAGLGLDRLLGRGEADDAIE
jgi:secreted PhoX family phosphatase